MSVLSVMLHQELPCQVQPPALLFPLTGGLSPKSSVTELVWVDGCIEVLIVTEGPTQGSTLVTSSSDS